MEAVYLVVLLLMVLVLNWRFLGLDRYFGGRSARPPQNRREELDQVFPWGRDEPSKKDPDDQGR